MKREQESKRVSVLILGRGTNQAHVFTAPYLPFLNLSNQTRTSPQGPCLQMKISDCLRKSKPA